MSGSSLARPSKARPSKASPCFKIFMLHIENRASQAGALGRAEHDGVLRRTVASSVRPSQASPCMTQPPFAHCSAAAHACAMSTGGLKIDTASGALALGGGLGCAESNWPR